MYSLLLLLPPFWLRTIFSLFSQLSANANRTRIPFFAFSFVSLVVHARSNSNLRYERKNKKKNINVIRWDFFAFLLATEKKKMNEKISFFFTDSAHTCLCNDVSNSNTMESYFFSSWFVWEFSTNTSATPRRQLNCTLLLLLLRKPIRLTRDSVYASQWNSKWRTASSATNFMSNTSESHTNCLSFHLLCFHSRRSIRFRTLSPRFGRLN